MLDTSDDQLQSIADAIVRRGFREPAIFILELCKPLVGCMRELYGVGEPVASALFGGERAPIAREILQSSDTVEALITVLERTRAER